MPMMLVLVQPQQLSTSKPNTLELKERLWKNKHPLRSSNRSPKPNPKLKKHKQKKEQQIAMEFDEEKEDENSLAFKRTRHMRGSLYDLPIVTTTFTTPK